MALVLKTKNNSGDITAVDDAMMFYALLGDGVLDGVYNSFKGTYDSSNKQFIISSGCVMFGGRRNLVDKNQTQVIDMTTFSSNKGYVILEMVIANDDEDSVSSVYVSTSNTATSSSPINVGTHKMLLFTLTKNGNTYDVEENFVRLLPGVAKNALNLQPNGVIGEETVYGGKEVAGANFWDVFLEDMSGVKYARESDVAAEAQGFVGGAKNVVTENLYLSARGVYLLQKAELIDVSDNITVPAKGSSQNFPFKNGTIIRSGGRKELMYIAGDKNTVIDWPFSDAGVHLGSWASTQQMKYQGLEIYIDSKNKTLKFTNNTDAAITLSGFKLNLYMIGG